MLSLRAVPFSLYATREYPLTGEGLQCERNFQVFKVLITKAERIELEQAYERRIGLGTRVSEHACLLKCEC